MKTYVLTNDAIPGEIYIHEQDNGTVKCDFSKSECSTNQQIAILRASEEGGLDGLRKYISSGARLRELEVTFDMFWARYDDKYCSSKKRTLAKWNKMSEIDRRKAFDYIPRYLNNLPNGTRQKYAETYLNAELWNN